MQLFVGSEVLDVKEQDMGASNMHLFVRHKDVQQVRMSATGPHLICAAAVLFSCSVRAQLAWHCVMPV